MKDNKNLAALALAKAGGNKSRLAIELQVNQSVVFGWFPANGNNARFQPSELSKERLRKYLGISKEVEHGN